MKTTSKKTWELSSINFGKFVLCAMAASLIGCATQQKTRPDTMAILEIKPDCRIAEQQLEWLRGLVPTEEEHRNAEMQMIFANTTTFEANRKIREYTYDRIIKTKINDIYYVCARR
jgi:hypothetical protein